VEGLVGPPGIAERIRTLGRDNIPMIIKEILGDAKTLPKEKKEERIDQAIRTSLAIITEGVVAAPIEGISRISLGTNPDGSDYLSIFFSGPIRSAGGTAQGMSVLIGEYISKELGLGGYRPTNDEVERVLEECRIYHTRIARLQYVPPEDDMRHILKKLVVCVDGDPTEEKEVGVHRDLKRVETNRIRGGMCLVLAEGIAQKAKKLMKNAKDYGIDWSWLSQTEMVKGKKANPEEKKELDEKPLKGVMAEVVAGRPIFATPSMKGGFRLRYGRSRTTGIAAKSIHPATVILLDEFIATGTQLKIEKPGKGCVITACDSIECPIVKLKNGNVLRVETAEQAKEFASDVEEILFLGDMLITYGDFLQTNTPLLPAGYCEEWWKQEAKDCPDTGKTPTAEEAFRLSKEYDIPLHPRYTYHWEDVPAKQLSELAKWLATGKIEDRGLIIEGLSREAKRTLEEICLPHEVSDGKVIIKEYAPALAALGLYNGTAITPDNFIKKSTQVTDEKATGTDIVKAVSYLKTRPKVGAYIGARMGRPEKAKERKMEPAVHSLFPIGLSGGKERSINAAASENTSISVNIARYECPNCGTVGSQAICANCGSTATAKNLPCLWNSHCKRYLPKLQGTDKTLGKQGHKHKGDMGESSRGNGPRPDRSKRGTGYDIRVQDT